MEIIELNISHLNAFKVYADECIRDGLDLYFSAVSDHSVFLKKRISYSKGIDLPDGWLPTSMFLCIKNGNILGAIRVRHGINDYIRNVIGHIGYETSPNARNCGVATFMLDWAKHNVIDNVAIVTCDAENVASKKVIQNCGGHYLDTFYSTEGGCEILRYKLKSV
jgi:predicted acetyltransferase